MWVQSLGWEDPLGKEMATLSSILAWEIPWTRVWRATAQGVTKSWTRLSMHVHMHVFLRRIQRRPPGKAPLALFLLINKDKGKER